MTKLLVVVAVSALTTFAATTPVQATRVIEKPVVHAITVNVKQELPVQTGQSIWGDLQAFLGFRVL
jgi:hypothetical protein